MPSFKPLESWPSIEKLAGDVKSGRTTAVELTEKSLSAIGRAQDYNALITVTDDYARSKAAEIDERIAKGEDVGPLAGVPFIAKDNYLTSGIETTAGSNILRGYLPPYSATVIEKMESAGAILVAKSNLDAFAHGSSTENSDYGPSKNPYDISRVPGGSSGGSAVATSLGLAPFSIGSDTGGSIRLPASFCGVVGLKPSYGLVSRYGVVAMASSTDCMGPLTTSVEDAAYVLDVMAGKDERDSTMIERKKSYRASEVDISSLKVGVVKEYMDQRVSAEVRQQVEESVERLKQKGASVETVSIPLSEQALACYYIIVPAEISSNLSRYDGVRYGLSDKEAASLQEMYERTRSTGFNDENKRRIMTGTYVLSSGYYDAYYKKAMTVRTKLINEFKTAVEGYDILIGPTAPTVAFKLGENVEDPLAMYLTDVMTVLSNLVGSPAISLPAGFNDEGLPIGLQVMAASGQDKQMLDAAAAVSGVVHA